MTDKQPLSTQEHNQVMQAMVDKWAESFGTGFAVYMVEQTNNSSPDESRAWNESMDRGRAIVEAVKHEHGRDRDRAVARLPHRRAPA